MSDRMWVCFFWRMVGEQGGQCHKGMAAETSPHDPDKSGCGWFVREAEGSDDAN